jgi:2,3-bisphosphoglycerate-dependent phosphoglycerate mutase
MDRASDRSTGEPGPAVWLVRHGESTWNALGLVQGQRTEPRLTRRGSAQARGVARHFRGRQVCALYTSDLLRAAETARPVAAALGLEPVVDRRLRERAFGSAESLPSSLLVPERSGFDAGRVVDPDAAPPGGESLRQLRQRVGDFLDELVADHDLRHGSAGDVVLVVHGGVVRAALAHLDGVPVGEMTWGPVGNGQVMSRPLAPPRPTQAAGRMPRARPVTTTAADTPSPLP